MFIIGIRLIADDLGLDPWDIDWKFVRKFTQTHDEPTSRFWFGSPCRFVRNLDKLVHIILPEMLYEKHPVWATYLRTTSPRWGRKWRTW
jgi:hypothetical protein